MGFLFFRLSSASQRLKEISVGKLLFFLLVALALYVLWGGLARFMALRARGDAPQNTPDASQAIPELMVSCSYCGTHIPLGETLKLREKNFCSEEHLRISQSTSQ
jgi:uncharacterized protein